VVFLFYLVTIVFIVSYNYKMKQDTNCLQNTVNILGDKWTPLILQELSVNPCTFSELEAKLNKISPRTLSQRLEKLCQEKIISKTIYCERPPRNQYSLTPKGVELIEVLSSMAKWGAKYCC
jgi:DNA-binding HxlR family transcriptional regulator